jgi:hypothetical protein
MTNDETPRLSYKARAPYRTSHCVVAGLDQQHHRFLGTAAALMHAATALASEAVARSRSQLQIDA